MGLFLFNADKKRKNRKQVKLAAPAGPSWSPERTHALLTVSLWMMAFVLLGVAWIWGQNRLEKTVAPKAPQEIHVEFPGLPTWMPSVVGDELRAKVAGIVSPDPFHHISLLEASAELRANPWVRSVERIVRTPGGTVSVIAQYRQYAALVRVTSGYHLIDREGVRLPFTYTTAEGIRSGLPLIHGVKSAPPAAGQPWPGGDVQAGLKLAALVASQPWAKETAAVDVTNFDGRLNARRGHLKILAAIDLDSDPFNNPGVEWGRTPGEESFEPAATWKLARIAAELKRDPRMSDRVLSVVSEPGAVTRLEIRAEEVADATESLTPSRVRPVRRAASR